jgi:hypothetical protein
MKPRPFPSYLAGQFMALLSPPRYAAIDPRLSPVNQWRKRQGRVQERHERMKHLRSPEYKARVSKMREVLKSGTVTDFMGFTFIKTPLV